MVSIIDDNPTRVIQENHLRVPKKYQADLYYSNKTAKKAYEQQLPRIAAEIAESAQYAQKEHCSFALAYLPYTQLGQVAVQWLVKTNSFTPEKAVEYIRNNPLLVDRSF